MDTSLKCYQCEKENDETMPEESKFEANKFFNPKIKIDDMEIYYCFECTETILQEYTRLKLMQLETEKQNSRRHISMGRILH